MVWFILVFIISCFVLLKSGTRAVKALSRTARVLGMEEFTAAFILMAFVSSLPEFFVAITSTLHNKAELAFGNIMGSNIIDLTLALALPILVSGQIITSGKSLQKNGFLTSLIALLPVVLLLDGSLGRIDGLILIFAGFLFFNNILKQGRRYEKKYLGVFNKTDFSFKDILKELVSFVFAVFILLFAAEAIVWSAGNLAKAANLPLLFLGAVCVSLGTTLPELVFGLKASKAEHNQMTLGNLMGAVVTHNTLILGFMFLIRPLVIFKTIPYISSLAFSVLAPLLFLAFVKTDKVISKKEAVVLLFVYLAFIVSQLVIL